jgi:hypothetical protein
MTAPRTAISGTISFYIETSPDAVNFTRQPGLSFQGPRAGAPGDRGADRIHAAGRRAAHDRARRALEARDRDHDHERERDHARRAHRASIRPRRTFRRPRRGRARPKYAKTDRLLLYPQSGLQFQWIEAAGPAAAPGRLSTARDFWSGARTLLADDYLEYEVYIDPNSPAADGTFASAARASNHGRDLCPQQRS